MLWLTYPPNLKSLPSAVTEMKCIKNAQNGNGLGWLGVTQGHRQCHHSIECIRNYASVLYHFRDMASYLWKFANFDLLHLHLAPPLGVTPFEFRKDFSQKKTIEYGIVCVILHLAVSVYDYSPCLSDENQTDRRRFQAKLLQY